MCVCLQVGKEFDALIIDTAAPRGAPVFDIFDGDTVEVSVLHTECTELYNIT